MASRTSFKSHLLRVCAVLVILGSITCSCLEFSYPTFDTANQADFSFSPGSGIANGSLQITPSTGSNSGRSGRVCYVRETLNLWNSKMTAPASFFTEFVLNIRPQNGTVGEGMAFILANNPTLPSDSSGQWLGITNNQTDGATANQVVAVEFDTRKSFKDDPDGNHVGIDINGINSTYWYPLSNLSIVLCSGSDVWVIIEYHDTAAMLRVQASQKGHNFVYFWPLDLSQHLLLENITLGFAASTGDFTVLNQIKSWNFSMPGGADAATDSKLGYRNRRKLILVLALLALCLIALLSIMLFFIWRRMTGQRRLAYRNLEKMIDAHGPVKFKLRELRRATANFSPARKLGNGGFGTVYLGYLDRTKKKMSIEVAVKRVSATGNSSRGEKEFLAEVNTISKLSHRNLVKLIGWCHESGELLLVYEYFPMGSLDKHLYTGGERSASTPPATTASPELTWERRYKIICGVASAMEYLHHGSSRRVLHRDVKATNVMVDKEYSARLGDFGLARVVVERDGGGGVSATHHSTQAVAGTRAYMAQESFFTFCATLATDVYAFGVFVMEVVSGRRPSSPVPYYYGVSNGDRRVRRRQQQQQDMYIVDWTWRLYGEGRAMHAVDDAVLKQSNCGGELDPDPAQVEHAVRLAVACCHPNPRERPSMRTVVQVLIGGAKAPEPPFHKPAFVWPPRGDEAPEIELPDVGLLFTGGQTTYCALSCSSFTGR